MNKQETKRGPYCFYLAVFLLPPLLLLLVYALRGVYPFGQGSVLTLDLNAQYVYYYEAYRGAFFENRSFFYSFSRSLGGEMAGLFAYYLASPFNLVLLLFPKQLLTEAVLCIILLKVGAAALTFTVYVKFSRGARNTPVFLFALMYGLMSYMVVQTMNPMWLDGPVFLPLVILGTERLAGRGRFGLLVVSLAAIFTANFYIGYMTGIFACLYLIYYLFAGDALPRFGYFVKRMAGFAGSALLSACCAAWLLIPTYFSLQMGKFGFTSPSFVPRQQLDIFDILSKLLPLNYDSVNYHGFPFIYAGTLVLPLLVFYFANSHIAPLKRWAAALFIAVMLACFTVSTLDMALHGFQGPIWLNFRYSFVLSFFLLALACDAYENLKQIDRTIILKSCLLLMLFTAFLGRLAPGLIEPETTLWTTFACLSIYSLLLFNVKRSAGAPPSLTLSKKISLSKLSLYGFILITAVSLELFLNARAMIAGAHEEVYYSDRPSYRDYFDRLYPVVDFIRETDSSFFRAETVIRRTVNDPMALGIYGVSHSSSTLNSKLIDYMFKLGFASREHWTRYKGATPLSDSVLGIKYVVSEKPVNNLYEPIFSKNEITVFHNPYALPVALAVNRTFLELSLDNHDPFVNQNAMYSAMLGEPYTEYFKLLPVNEYILENMIGEGQNGLVSYYPIDPAYNAHIEYLIATAGENEMYMYLYSEHPRKVNLWLNHEYLDTFFDYESTCIIPLGAHPDLDVISLITTPVEGEYYLNSNMFYYLDRPLFETAASRLKEKGAGVEKITETHLRVTIDASQSDILFTSIPYEKGWRARINGDNAAIIPVFDTLMAVELSPGEQVVDLYFIPHGFVPGCFISGVAVIILVFLLLRYHRDSVRVIRPEISSGQWGGDL